MTRDQITSKDDHDISELEADTEEACKVTKMY